MSTTKQKTVSPTEVASHIKQLQSDRETLLVNVDKIDQEMLKVFNDLEKALKSNGTLPNQARINGRVRESSGTGKVLSIISSLAKGNPKIVRTSLVVAEAKRKYGIKYPHSSFQSLQSTGYIKLATPSRGFITFLK